MFHDSSQASDYSTAAYSTAVFSDCTEVVDTGFSFAFQPVVDAHSRETVGHEALVRGLSGESAATVLGAIRPENRYYFDQACRMRALRAAARRGIDGAIHLNCSQISPENLALSIDATIEAANEHGISPDRVVLEFGSLEMLGNPRQLDKAREMAHAAGLKVLADNIGVGEVGLKRLAVFRPDFAKLDRSLIRGIDSSARRQAIVCGVIATCNALGIGVIATGVEREEEMSWLKRAGIRLAQGFYFAHPTLNPTAERKVA
jgi:EAL domain-containing protein (putative c-di-GMP-specific phosphodiesterase class I)